MRPPVPAKTSCLERVLAHEAIYDLHSRHFLSADDLPFARAWAASDDPRWGALLRLRNTRTTRRKEFYETCFVLDRLAPELARVSLLCEVGAGHGLLGLLAVVLHRNLRHAILVDRRATLTFGRASEFLAVDHPFVKTRVTYVERRLQEVHRVPSGALVLGVHCCGGLTDHLAAMARASGAPFAVVPCCESRLVLSRTAGHTPEVGGDAVAHTLNAHRVATWRAWGYRVEERALPAAVTPRGRLFVAWPGFGEHSRSFDG